MPINSIGETFANGLRWFAVVLSNTIVIVHDILLINTPVIIEPRQIFFPPGLKTGIHFLGEKEILERKKKKKRYERKPDMTSTIVQQTGLGL